MNAQISGQVCSAVSFVPQNADSMTTPKAANPIKNQKQTKNTHIKVNYKKEILFG